MDPTLLGQATDWLAARVRPGDLALLYVAGEYQYFDADLAWNATFPALWNRVPTPRRVLVVETCFGERLTAAIGAVSGLGLPAVGRGEMDWWGLHESDRLIRGASFTYFLAKVLQAQPADDTVDYRAAFASAVSAAQRYFRDVILTTPGALGSFHVRGAFPE